MRYLENIKNCEPYTVYISFKMSVYIPIYAGYIQYVPRILIYFVHRGTGKMNSVEAEVQMQVWCLKYEYVPS